MDKPELWTNRTEDVRREVMDHHQAIFMQQWAFILQIIF